MSTLLATRPASGSLYIPLSTAVMLIRDSDLSACTTAIPTSPDPDPIQSPVTISIEFKTDTIKSGRWMLIARGTCP